MKRLLVVDDEIDLCRFLHDYLSSRGYDVDFALNGKEALEKIESNPPRLVLLDIRMPGMGGVEVLAQIKLKHPDVDVIMVTAVYEEELGRQCLNLGAKDFITKPINLQYLETSLLSQFL